MGNRLVWGLLMIVFSLQTGYTAEAKKKAKEGRVESLYIDDIERAIDIARSKVKDHQRSKTKDKYVDDMQRASNIEMLRAEGGEHLENTKLYFDDIQKVIDKQQNGAYLGEKIDGTELRYGDLTRAIDYKQIREIRKKIRERIQWLEKIKQLLEYTIYRSTSGPRGRRTTRAHKTTTRVPTTTTLPKTTTVTYTEKELAIQAAQRASYQWEMARSEAKKSREMITNSKIPELERTFAEGTAELDSIDTSQATNKACSNVAIIARTVLLYFTRHYIEDYILVLVQLDEVVSSGDLVISALNGGNQEVCAIRSQTAVLAKITSELDYMRSVLDTRHDYGASYPLVNSTFALLRCVCGSTAPSASTVTSGSTATTLAMDITIPPTSGSTLDPTMVLQEARRTATNLINNFEQVQIPTFQGLQSLIQGTTLPTLRHYYSTVNNETKNYYQTLNNVQDICSDTSSIVSQLLDAVVRRLETELEGLIADFGVSDDSSIIAALKVVVTGTDLCDIRSRTALAGQMVSRIERVRLRLNETNAFVTDSFLASSPVALMVDLQHCVCSHVTPSEAPTTVAWSTLVPSASSVNPLNYCDDTNYLSSLHLCWKPACKPRLGYLKSDSGILD